MISGRSLNPKKTNQDSPETDIQQEHAGANTAGGATGKNASTLGASLAFQVARDMVGLMTEHGPEILGFDSVPIMRDSIVGETNMQIVAT